MFLYQPPNLGGYTVNTPATPPQNVVLGGYTVFSLSVILSFRNSGNILSITKVANFRPLYTLNNGSLRGPTHIEQKVKGLFFHKTISTYICIFFFVIICLNYQIVYILLSFIKL